MARRRYVRTVPAPLEVPSTTTPTTEDVYTEIRALLQRRLDRLHVEEQRLQDMLTNVGGPAPILDEPQASTPVVAAAADKPRTRRKMSPAARKAAAERMKAYWAAKRQEKG